MLCPGITCDKGEKYFTFEMLRDATYFAPGVKSILCSNGEL